MSAILTSFITIFFAEFLDKSQLSILLLATKTKKHVQLFIGTVLAFLIVDGLAIFFGAFITTIIPVSLLRYLSAGLFIFFGVMTLLHKDSEEDEIKVKTARSIIVSGFFLVFLSEWGDKTQLAAALFATNYPPILVLIGVMAALSLLSLIAILFGQSLTKVIPKRLIERISASIFILIGLVILITTGF